MEYSPVYYTLSGNRVDKKTLPLRAYLFGRGAAPMKSGIWTNDMVRARLQA